MSDLKNEEIEGVEFREIMRAECQVDVYYGPNCDAHGDHSWYAYADGDKDGDHTDRINLHPAQFFPGTRVQVLEPECPRCRQPRWACQDDEGCDFPWKQWDDALFS